MLYSEARLGEHSTADSPCVRRRDIVELHLRTQKPHLALPDPFPVPEHVAGEVRGAYRGAGEPGCFQGDFGPGVRGFDEALHVLFVFGGAFDRVGGEEDDMFDA